MSKNNRLTRRLIHITLLKLPSVDLKNKQTAWWIISTAYCLIISIFFLSALMRVRQISCVTEINGPCPDYIIPAFSKLRGKLIYLVDTKDITRQILTVVPQAMTVEISKVWPSTLSIKILEQYPVANLQIPASSSALIVGNNKYVTDFLTLPNPNLPKIISSAAASIAVGDHITDEAIASAIDISIRMPSLQTILINSPLEIRALDRDSNRYLFTSNKSINSQLDALQLILATTTINTTAPIYDLRFDHPVLKQTW